MRNPLSLFLIVWIQAALGVSSASAVPAAEEESPEQLERWDRVVGIVEQSTSADGKATGEIGSAFVLAHEGEHYLVTAAHVAQFTTAKSRLIFRDRSGNGQWISLGGLCDAAENPWRKHPAADLAAMRILDKRLDEAVREGLRRLAMDFSSLCDHEATRSTEIEITGFPLALGVQPTLSPIVMKGAVASREMEVDGKWGKERIQLAFPVVGDGTSGGPAFRAIADVTAAEIVGMYVGYKQDKSGPKLSMLVPASVIRDFLSPSGGASATEATEPATDPNQDP